MAEGTTQHEALDELVERWHALRDAGGDTGEVAAEIVALARRDESAEPTGASSFIVGLEMAGSYWTFLKAMQRPARERRRGCLVMLVIAVAGAIIVSFFPDSKDAIEGFFHSLLAIVLIGVVGMCVAVWRAKRRRGDIGVRRCPACKYDFLGIPDAVPAAALGGVEIGPRACPGCGRRWPLLG